MEIKKFVIKNRAGYEDRTDCWFRTGNVWHQTVPYNCLLLTLDPNVKNIFNENLFVILDSEDHGNTYGKTKHTLEEHNIILSSSYAPATIFAEQNGPDNSIGYVHTNSQGHNHEDITLYSGNYSEESFYSLFDRYAVGAYTKDYILSNSLLLSTKDISNGNIEKIAENLQYFLFIDTARRGKLEGSRTHNHGGTGYINIPSLNVRTDDSYSYTKASTTGLTTYISHSHKVNYNISSSTKRDTPKKYLATYYNKTITNLYFDELPIGTIMLFIDEYNDYMSNWIPLECSKSYCCNINIRSDYNYGSQDIYSATSFSNIHTATISSSSLVSYDTNKDGGNANNTLGFSVQDHSHTFTLGDCEDVYLEPYGLMLKPYIKISDNKPNF